MELVESVPAARADAAATATAQSALRVVHDAEGHQWHILLSSPTQLTPSHFWRIIKKWTMEPAYKQIHKVEVLDLRVRRESGVEESVAERVPQAAWYEAAERGEDAVHEVVYTRHLYPKDYTRKSEMDDVVRHFVSRNEVHWTHTLDAATLPYYYAHARAYAIALVPLSAEEQAAVKIVHSIQQPAKKGDAPHSKQRTEDEAKPEEEPGEEEVQAVTKRARLDEAGTARATAAAEPELVVAAAAATRSSGNERSRKRARERELPGEDAAIDFDGSPFAYRLVFSARLFPPEEATLPLDKLVSIARYQLQLLNRWGAAERNAARQLPRASKASKQARSSEAQDGAATGYVKRVHHDVVVDRDAFTAHYRRLKERHSHWVAEWEESTDPNKFVYEDLGIAAFLLALWDAERADCGLTERQTFVDLGAGNGFLVYVLVLEGHRGVGIDLQRRKIWDKYPPEVRECLQEQALAPDTATLTADWLLANHSDELTPWVPLLAARATPHHVAPSCAHTRYFVLPCCEWDFDRRYQRKQTHLSRYEAYLAYVASIGSALGFVVETEHLRIPSTRNIAHIARRLAPTRPTLDLAHTERALLSAAGFVSFKPKERPGKDHRK